MSCMHPVVILEEVSDRSICETTFQHTEDMNFTCSSLEGNNCRADARKEFNVLESDWRDSVS